VTGVQTCALPILKKALVQGTEVTVVLSTPDGKSVSQRVTYDTQEFALESFKLDGVKLSLVNGNYEIVKPFDVGAGFQKSYVLSFEQKNILSTTPISYTVTTEVPVGATAASSTSLLVTALQSNTFNVNSTTTAGLYKHTVTLGRKTLTINVLVKEPVAEVVMDDIYSYTAAASGDVVKFSFGYTTVGTAPTTVAQRVLPGADGSYTITKPFATTTTQREIKFGFLARNFDKPDFVNNQYNIQITGPSKFSSNPTVLFSGMETAISQSTNDDNLTSPITFAGATGFGAGTSTRGTVSQKIDYGTPDGKYTFTITAGRQGAQVVKEVVVNVQSVAPSINFIIESYKSTADMVTTGANADEIGLATRDQFIDSSTANTFVIEKPSIAGTTFTLKWFATLQNYQSYKLDSNEFSEITADSLITNNDDKKLFSATSGVKVNATNFPAAKQLVKKGVTTPVSVKALVKVSDTRQVTVKVTPDEAPGDTNLSATSANGLDSLTKGGLTLASTTAAVTIPAGAANRIVEITLGTYSTTSGSANGDRLSFELSSPLHGTVTFENSNSTTDYVVQVSDFPDAIEMGSAEATGTSNYRFVNLGLQASGPSSLFSSFTTTRTAMLLADNKNGLVLFNQTQTALTEAMVQGYLGTTFTLDAKDYRNLPYDLDTDLVGLNRKPLEITTTTVAGTYTLKFMVDNVVREIKIQINNPQPKVFVFSGFENIDNNDLDLLKNNEVRAAHPSLVFTNSVITQGNVGTNSFYYQTSGTRFNALQVFDNDGILPLQVSNSNLVQNTNYFPSDLDRFVLPLAGVYTVEMPTVAPKAANRDILFAQIAVTELPKGEYDYSITKKYPDGRVENYSDKVKVTAVDTNQLATFDQDNKKFINNWVVNETSYVLGKYEYTFIVNNINLSFTVDVVKKPQLTIDAVKIGTRSLPLFDGKYLSSPAGILGSVSLDFTQVGLTDANFYSVTATDLEGDGTTADSIKSDLPATAVLESFKDLTALKLGKIEFETSRTTVDIGDYIKYDIRFYRVGTKPLATAANSALALSGVIQDDVGYLQVGETLQVNVMAANAPVLNVPALTVSSDVQLIEGSENGTFITVTMSNGTFVDDIAFTDVTITTDITTNGTLNAAPITDADYLVLVNPNTIRLRLAGNSTTSYRTTSKLNVAIAGNKYKDERGTLVASPALNGVLSLVPATFTNITAAEVNATTADHVIIVSLTGATFKNRTLRLDDFTSAQTLSNAKVTRISATEARITVAATNLAASATTVVVQGSALASRTATATAAVTVAPLADIGASTAVTAATTDKVLIVTLTNAVFNSNPLLANFTVANQTLTDAIVTRISNTEVRITVAATNLANGATTVAVSKYALASQAASDVSVTLAVAPLAAIAASAAATVVATDKVLIVTLTNAVFNSNPLIANFTVANQDISSGSVTRISDTVVVLKKAANAAYVANATTTVAVSEYALASQAASAVSVAVRSALSE
jgi:hypothetical protein